MKSTKRDKFASTSFLEWSHFRSLSGNSVILSQAASLQIGAECHVVS